MKWIILSTIFFSLNVSSQTILFIGDSQTVGPFGKRLDESLRSVGLNVESYGVVGSVLRWFETSQKTNMGYWERKLNGKEKRLKSATTPKLKKLIQKIKPDLVIMQFSGNYRDRSFDFIQRDIQEMLELIRIQNTRCYFVTGPDARKRRVQLEQAIIHLQNSINNGCGFFLSTLVTKYPAIGGDGYHYSFPGGEKMAQNWADLVFQDVTKFLLNN